MTAVVASPRSARQIRLVVFGLMLGMFVMGLDTLLIVTALPTIVGDLGGFDKASWLLASFLITSTASAPVWGKLGDLWGRKRLYQAAVILFGFTSILCALSQNIDQLIAARAVRGIAAGGLMVLPVAIVGDVVPGRESARYLGMLNANVAVATLLGPLIGGFFVDNASWRWAFMVGVPPAIVAVLASRRLDVPPGRITLGNVDYLGAVLAMSAAVALLLIVTLGGHQIGWLSTEAGLLLALGVVLLVLLVIVERRVAEPTVPLDLFRIHGFAHLMLAWFVSGVAMFGPWSLMPLFLQLVTGASATLSGLLLLSLIVSISTSSYLCGAVMQRTGRTKSVLVTGMVLATIGFSLYTTLDAESGRLLPSLMMIVTGFGLGGIIQPGFVIAQSLVTTDKLGVATSTTTFFRQLGQAFGGAIAVSLFTSRLDGHLERHLSPAALATLDDEVRRATPAAVARLEGGLREQVEEAFAGALHDGFTAMVPIALLALVIMLALPSVRLRDRDAESDVEAELAAPAEAVGGVAVVHEDAVEEAR